MRPFSITISSEQLIRGLRPSSRSPRNSGFLIECDGAVGQEGALEAIEELSRVDTSVITDVFPFPQIFVFTKVIIVCGLSKIYELSGGVLTLKYTATTPDGLWSAVDFHDFVYMSNGSEAVVRDAFDYNYSLTTDYPTATAICNYNGQVLIGAPDVSGFGASLTISADPLEVTTTIRGEYS